VNSARRARTVSVLALLAAALITIATLVVLRSRDAGRPDGPPIPAHDVYLGAWVEPAPFTQAGRVTSVKRFEQAIGRRLDIVHLYRTWGMPIGTESDLAFARSGKYLLISWATPDTRRIASGHDDRIIEQTAEQIGALPTKVFLEIRWEMDRPNLHDVVHTPQDFIAAWNHIRAIFARENVTNVAWTWCPTAVGFVRGEAAKYYPGDGAVDWVCADVYPTTPWVANSYQSFAGLVTPFLNWASHHPKPIIIGEFAIDVAYGANRARWIRDAGAFVESHPKIKAVAWFEQSLPTSADFKHWALEGDPAAMRAFRDVVSSANFGKDD
jgi:hypothetical protein